MGYAQAYSFKYSPRPGTPAAERAEVGRGRTAERLQRLQALLAPAAGGLQAAQVGRVVPVLFEKPGRMPGQMAGRSPYLNAVHLDGAAEMAGRIVEVGSSPRGRIRWPGCWRPEGVIRRG